MPIGFILAHVAPRPRPSRRCSTAIALGIRLVAHEQPFMTTAALQESTVHLASIPIGPAMGVMVAHTQSFSTRTSAGQLLSPDHSFAPSYGVVPMAPATLETLDAGKGAPRKTDA